MNSIQNNFGISSLGVDHYPSATTEPSPEEIRAFLIEKGVLPTPEQAKEVFWSLGDDWWKQIIDGRLHQFGPLACDNDRPGRAGEVGYLKGIKEGSLYFTNCFDQELSLQLYKDTHRKTCSHFKIDLDSDNRVCCDAHEIDLFRKGRSKCSLNILDPLFAQLEETFEKIEATEQRLSETLNDFNSWNEQDDDPDFALYEMPESLEKMQRMGIE